MTSRVRAAVALLSLVACAGSGGPAPPGSMPTATAAPSAGAAPIHLTAMPIPLPGASGNASLDYLAYERGARRVWVPVGSTGSVDVMDTSGRAFTRVDGFGTAEREIRGAKRTIGPSAVSIGDGFAYVGDRGTSEVCAIDTKTLKLGKCLKLPMPIDGVVYVAPSKEVWVTAPHDRLLVVLDAANPAQLATKSTIQLDGEPEGYAVDDSRGLFFTNLEDKGGTVVIDVKTHKPQATWQAGCSDEGPRGVAVDTVRRFVLVACTDRLQVLDAAHDGRVLGTLDTGAGVDNIDYVEATMLVYVAAGKSERLSIARLDDQGRLALVATGTTSAGARNPVADESGNVYVADSAAARILFFDGRAVK